MAETESPSSPSTSEKTPVGKPGLGLLISDTPPSDPIISDQVVQGPAVESSENGVSDSPVVKVAENGAAGEGEEKMRNAIQREIYDLTVEAAYERLQGVAIDEDVKEAHQVEKDNLNEEKLEKHEVSVQEENGDDNKEDEMHEKMNTERKDDLNQESNEKDGESSEGGEENERGNMENVEWQSGEAAGNLGMFNYNNNNRRRMTYPMRPDAEDCAFYMKSGTCKFGLNCKFNHPPRRKNQVSKEKGKHWEENSGRAGQTECKYYLTSGGCKYGKDCRYSHNSEKSTISSIPEFNFLGLPIRPGEKECPYYMRTGSCKYGSNCRFHHPDPTTVGVGDSGFGNGGSLSAQLVSSPSVSSWSSPRAFNETSSFVPVMFPPTQVAQTPSTDWNGHQDSAYPTSERGLPTPPAFAINNLPTEINFPLQNQHDMIFEEYPERPGEPECNYFLKTGDCKFKSNCKFHHPKNRFPKAKSNACALSDKGLPLRPDQPICAHYHRYGICKYGPACKYDHPSKFGILSPPFNQLPFDNSKPVDGAETSMNENNGGSLV